MSNFKKKIFFVVISFIQFNKLQKNVNNDRLQIFKYDRKLIGKCC